jgi:hypothetical protein
MATGDASGDHGHRDAVAARARREKPSTFEATIGPGCRPATLPRVSPKRQPSKDNRQHHRHDGNIQGEDRHAVRGLSINGFARRLSRGNELKDRGGSLGGRVTLQPCILYFRAAFDWRSKPCDVNVCRTASYDWPVTSAISRGVMASLAWRRTLARRQRGEGVGGAERRMRGNRYSLLATADCRWPPACRPRPPAPLAAPQTLAKSFS